MVNVPILLGRITLWPMPQFPRAESDEKYPFTLVAIMTCPMRSRRCRVYHGVALSDV